MLTLSGHLVLPGMDNAPTLEDIAVGLGRVPRFGGQTRCWWPVLLHAHVCDRLMREQLQRYALVAPADKPVTPADIAGGRLVALFHDAHEAVTGDIPTPWKTDEVKAQQMLLDTRIFRNVLGCDTPPHLMPAVVRSLMLDVDRRALLAEAEVVGPPGFDPLFPGATRNAEDVEIVKLVRLLYPTPGHTNGSASPAVEDFISLTKTQLFILKGEAK